ncbi:MAG: CAP domain-containing protein [Clostridia bacterium]|nr:CAP domain-containing protein [Clostridia bacterium]
MAKKLLSLLLIFILIFSLASCGKIRCRKQNTTKKETTTESTTRMVTETATEEESETAETTETTKATETTEVKTTEITTSQRVSQVITTAVRTTTSVMTSVKYNGKTTTDTKVTRADLKYGVDRIRTVTTTYGISADGKKFVISEETSDRYDRSTYSASYSELLPAARTNRQNYASYINEVLRLTNQMRAEGGLAPLTLSNKLTEQANVRAEEVAWAGAKAHGHIRPNTRSYKSIFTENGYNSGLIGENVGWYYSSPSAVCAAWKASETHYANIMNPEFKSIGIGVAPEADPSLGLCWVQHFYSA